MALLLLRFLCPPSTPLTLRPAAAATTASLDLSWCCSLCPIGSYPDCHHWRTRPRSQSFRPHWSRGHLTLLQSIVKDLCSVPSSKPEHRVAWSVADGRRNCRWKWLESCLALSRLLQWRNSWWTPSGSHLLGWLARKSSRILTACHPGPHRWPRCFQCAKL